jgi:hypothetical protein
MAVEANHSTLTVLLSLAWSHTLSLDDEIGRAIRVDWYVCRLAPGQRENLHIYYASRGNSRVYRNVCKPSRTANQHTRPKRPYFRRQRTRAFHPFRQTSAQLPVP